jgi:hypothetical protein
LLPPAASAPGAPVGSAGLSVCCVLAGFPPGAVFVPAMLFPCCCWLSWPVAGLVDAVAGAAVVVGAVPGVVAVVLCPVSPWPALRGLVWPPRLVVTFSKQV